MPDTPTAADPKAVTAALAAPFHPRDIKFKPQMVKGNRGLAMAYIDARLVQDRLDEVLGVENWQDEYQVLSDGSVVCKLQLLIGDRWVTKTDVGGPSEQPDGGDRLKAAFSDALKRAAVKFGVGRYLYRLPAQWVDYDPQKKQFVGTPQMPAFALPKPAAKPAAKPLPGPSDATPPPRRGLPAAAPGTAPEPAPSKDANGGPGLPADGKELHTRLSRYDARLADQKVCPAGALLAHVAKAGAEAGYGDDIAAWAGPAIPFAVEAVRTFQASVRAAKPAAGAATAA